MQGVALFLLQGLKILTISQQNKVHATTLFRFPVVPLVYLVPKQKKNKF